MIFSIDPIVFEENAHLKNVFLVLKLLRIGLRKCGIYQQQLTEFSRSTFIQSFTFLSEKPRNIIWNSDRDLEIQDYI